MTDEQLRAEFEKWAGSLDVAWTWPERQAAQLAFLAAYNIGRKEGYRAAIDFVASGTEHPVDVLKSCATYMGLKLDTEVESQMRAYCDEPVEACEFGARGHYGG